MKFSENWLHEWVKPALTREELCHSLTMSGFEVESVTPVAEAFQQVVVAEVISLEKHPEADRLNICKVNIGKKDHLTIVCGATNVKPGMKAPAALVGALLPNNKKIEKGVLRGVTSEGMLCSAADLGLTDDNEGLFELSFDAPVGEDFWHYLQLSDYIIDVSITPNRGDCLSIKGISREVAAITHSPLTSPTITESEAAISDTLAIHLHTPECPNYVGRVIRNVNLNVSSPIWLKERLRRGGIRSINPVVDVTNYVMLELGQPMHAFDLDKIEKAIHVRFAKANEKLLLLDGNEATLDEKTLVISDEAQPLAIAGVMGGVASSVTATTKNIFLESAFFTPSSVARQRQHYGITSESASRFERGVDYKLQRSAIERATQLLLAITGGQAGPVTEKQLANDLPKEITISLPQAKIKKILGVNIPEADVQRVFQDLGLHFKKSADGWDVVAPSYRFDLRIAEDLIEEIARLYGFDKIFSNYNGAIVAPLQILPQPEDKIKLSVIKKSLCDLGYNEVVTYSFIDKKSQKLLDPERSPKELLNPITADMSVMRTSLWPGLINVLIYNKSRQQNRVRIFETGLCFLQEGTGLTQQTRLAGLISGEVFPQQWGMGNEQADFFDLKGDIQNLLGLTKCTDQFSFEPANHPALHPGQTAAIYCNGKEVGIFGAIHPSVLQELDISSSVFVFELDVAALEHGKVVRYQEISKYPEIKRDLSILIDQTVPAGLIQVTIKQVAREWLKEMTIFDVYQGKGIATGFKSIALSFVLQHPARTLVEDEVNSWMDEVIQILRNKFGAELRS